jgi:hypothetical protein
MWLIWLSLIVLAILVVIAIPYGLKEVKNFLTHSPIVEDFGSFPYTIEEWEYVHQKEFVEDEKGRKFSDKYINIVSYGNNLRENAQRKIFFDSEKIYLTDGKQGKSFTVNRLNYVGNGFKLISIDLLHLSPLKKLKIGIEVVGASSETTLLDFSIEYLVPIPQSSLQNIDEILKAYGKIILDS